MHLLNHRHQYTLVDNWLFNNNNRNERALFSTEEADNYCQELLGTSKHIYVVKPQLLPESRKDFHRKLIKYNYQDVLKTLRFYTHEEFVETKRLNRIYEDASEKQLMTRKHVEVLKPKFLNEERLEALEALEDEDPKETIKIDVDINEHILNIKNKLNIDHHKLKTFINKQFIDYIDDKLKEYNTKEEINNENIIEEDITGDDITEEEEEEEGYGRIERRPEEWIMGEELERMLLDQYKLKKWYEMPSMLIKSSVFPQSVLKEGAIIEFRTVPFYIKKPIIKKKKYYYIYVPNAKSSYNDKKSGIINRFRYDWFLKHWKGMWSEVYMTARGKRIVPQSIRRCYFNPVYSTRPTERIYHYEVVKRPEEKMNVSIEELMDGVIEDLRRYKHNGGSIDEKVETRRRNNLYSNREVVYDKEKYNLYHMAIYTAERMKNQTLILDSDLIKYDRRRYQRLYEWKLSLKNKKLADQKKEAMKDIFIVSNKDTPTLYDRFGHLFKDADYTGIFDDPIIKNPLYDDWLIYFYEIKYTNMYYILS